MRFYRDKKAAGNQASVSVSGNNFRSALHGSGRLRIIRKVCDVGACANVAARPFAHTGDYAQPGGLQRPLF